jgi:hypothetical protein
MMQTWNLAVGARATRKALNADYGGGSQGGIIPSASTPNVLLFSDPTKAKRFGYDYDGWTADGTHFLYTGEGQVDEQTLDKGNLAIVTHRERGKALRLFVAVDRVPGTGTLVHEYVGEFEIDAADPYHRAEALDRENTLRSVLVFRLAPVGSALRRNVDSSGSGDALAFTVTALVNLEASEVDTFFSPGSAPAIGNRREATLTDAFSEHLRSRGHQLHRWRIRPAGELRTLWTDIYDSTTKTLYEAKSSATRDAVRNLVGQLLDYKRHIDVPDLNTAALLPSQPSADLLNLIHSVGAACVWRTAKRDFVRSEPV